MAVTLDRSTSVLERRINDVEDIRVDVDPVVVALNESGGLKQLEATR